MVNFLIVYRKQIIEQNLIFQESGEEDDKKMMRIIHKKSQTVTQAHMCNYCNYTSPKRWDWHLFVKIIFVKASLEDSIGVSPLPWWFDFSILQPFFFCLTWVTT